MAATGFTPISLYYSTTASAVPTAGNLANGELALNTADMKLYAKNSSGVVTLLASNAATSGVSSFSAGTTGFTPSTGTTGAVTLAGTLNVANGGTGLTSLTANRIPYGNGTSAFGNSASLQFDGTRLGVGLTPTANTYGIQSATGISASTSVVAQGTLQGYTGAGIFLSYESTYGRLESYDYTGSAFKNIAIAPNGGNVGIGTTSPGAKLVVSGSGNIVRLGDGTNTFDIRFQGPNNWAQQLNTSTDVFSLQRNSIALWSFAASGALGIGSSPSYGSAGQVLTSAGSGSAPTWATAGGGTYVSFAFAGTTSNYNF